MQYPIIIKRGGRSTLPVLRDGEPALCIDTGEIFVGSPLGNIPVNISPNDFSVGSYTIPGETTKLIRAQGKTSDPYTVFEIASPESSKWLDNEATLTLMREGDSDSGGAEFMDLYNNGYSDSRQMGIRVQSRGGVLRPFMFDFFDGVTRYFTLKIEPTRITALKPIYFPSDTLDSSVGRTTDRLRLYNGKSGGTLDYKDDGTTVHYSPTGDYYVYLDAGAFYINDERAMTLKKGTTAQRPTGTARFIGMEYYDTTLSKPVWWNGTVWKDAMATTV